MGFLIAFDLLEGPLFILALLGLLTAIKSPSRFFPLPFQSEHEAFFQVADLGAHKRDNEIARYISDRAVNILFELGAEDVKYSVGGASANLQAGGCRFGEDPKTSVLDRNCKVHSTDNLYVTDASFMPTGGSVTYTWTIYANSFRVADHLLEKY